MKKKYYLCTIKEKNNYGQESIREIIANIFRL